MFALPRVTTRESMRYICFVLIVLPALGMVFEPVASSLAAFPRSHTMLNQMQDEKKLVRQMASRNLRQFVDKRGGIS